MAKPNFLKVIILGDGAVGKSALMNRFVNNKFDNQSFHTIGVEFLNKEVKYRGEVYTLQIWDTAGQERFRSLRTPFYRGSDICLLVYGLDDEQSFYNLDTWKREFLYYADVKDAELFPFILLGNKSDLEHHEVHQDQVDAWCHANGNMKCFLTSAKNSTNVEQAFVASVEKWLTHEQTLDKNSKPGANYNNAVNLRKQQQNTAAKPTESKTCC